MKVKFYDHTMEAAVRKEINKPHGDITITELESVKELYVAHFSDQGSLSSIDLLQYCTNLKKLSLLETGIRDISILSKLKKLEYLDLQDNSIEDLEPLNCLNNLVYLDLSYNPVTDMNPIGNLNKVKYLNLYETKVVEIKLDGFLELEFFGISL
ncbi:leucine-rich repeat domain-containing protein [Oceanirhabdus sp. W0125-5]|uniref:leucine-rich repeat domain-containing protein n=1 Tax=Oceanirhabdus sp. W0125-5 TaxID=2999116 RepID=UPI0022F2F336|nr:leucine-rich repeat domain-containing protein [Oceanirhabdus sp. W0125-5]WBW98156.1 leucine-rich repeat domain-containing protein [Oceanirhabdus sp. W0125-5]